VSDKIQKFLAKLSSRELEKILAVTVRIQAADFGGLNIKPMKGHKGFFRVRVGRVRIIFKLTAKGYEIIHITNRDDQTYRDF